MLAGKQIKAFTQADRESFLIGMMKVNYLKRLESSIKSFEISISRTLEKIEKLEAKIAQFKSNHNQILYLESLSPDEDELDEEDLEQWQVGKKLKFDLADLDLDRWLVDLQNDKAALAHIHDNALLVTPEKDAKLHELKTLITAKINQPINAGNKKIIIFTAFADTANYLYSTLKNWYSQEFKLDCALVCGSMTQTTLGKNDYYKETTSEGGKVFAQVKIEILRQLSIPKRSPDQQQPFIELVDEILSPKKSGHDTSALEREIDLLVYGVYGLTKEEIRIVEGQ